MTTTHLEKLANMYDDDDHPSLDASLDDFEAEESPRFALPSQHSGFKSDDISDKEHESNSEGPWSPSWKKREVGSGWYRHQPYLQESPMPRSSPSHRSSPLRESRYSASRSRESSFESAMEDEEEDNDITIAARVPLPGSVSPVKHRSRQPTPDVRPLKENPPPPLDDYLKANENKHNYIRFALRADVQQQTDSIETFLLSIQSYLSHLRKNRLSLLRTISMILFAILSFRFLFHPPADQPLPDLTRVASLARSFEPLLFYSENGVRQISDLQQTSVAVWDLGESVRGANMSTSATIVRELDELSESYKMLAHELTKFFANVDGDVDGLVMVMEWAERELANLPRRSPSDDYDYSLSAAYTNVHGLLSRAGLLQSRGTGESTALGKVMDSVFGQTPAQRTHATLQRTFHEFIGVLEESISSQLTYATQLFALFAQIDRQFQNLQRTTVRELGAQELEEKEFLSGLWTKMLGGKASTLRKYERNRQLLATLRGRTVNNKEELERHSGRLVAMRQGLEAVRKRLVSPLVQGMSKDGLEGDLNSIAGGGGGGGPGGVPGASRLAQTTVGVDEQIKALEGTREFLRTTREEQRGRVFEILYGEGSGRGAGLKKFAQPKVVEIEGK
ncbi:hypothetical protein MMC25_002755 [Agyrium rufum]|nr:hypothetical protein [Agyrium rufum]